MEEQSSSWIRRAKFSHTVYHRFDTTSKLPSGAYSRLSSFPSTHTVERNDVSVVKSRPRSTTSTNQSLGSSVNTQIPQAHILKQRSLSPTPVVALPETFKEARSDQQRYSTPCPRRNETEKKVINKLSRKDAQYKLKSQSLSSSNNLLRHFSGMRISEKSKNKKDSTWSKYFDRGGGKITALNTADELTVDLSKLFLGLRFASGAHSRLHHGIYKDQPVAVKIIRQPDDDENGVMAARLEKQFNREVTLLSHLHHENVIKLVAACRNPPVFCIITEYLAGGSLRKFLHKLEKNPVPLPKLIAIALDIARGMQYVHSQGVIHRDLKPENILFDEEFKLKVADFGIACEEAYCESLAEDPGTYRWMAPEMIKHKSYGRKVDVYSFGLVLWEMATGVIPYEEMTPIQAAYAVVNKNLRPGIPANCPPALKALIEQCWASNSDKRPDFWQIVKVLEQFESSVARDGTLNQVPKLISQDQKKGGLLRWIQKLGPANSNSTPMPKPKIF